MMHILQQSLILLIVIGAVSGTITGTDQWAGKQDFPSTQAASSLTCSNGANGLITRWQLSDLSTLGNCWMELPTAVWNSEDCGKCVKVTDTYTGNSMFLTVVSGGGSLNIKHTEADQTGPDSSFYKLFGWRGVKIGNGRVNYQEVEHNMCHGNQGLDGNLAPTVSSTCGFVAGPLKVLPKADPKQDLKSTYHPPYSLPSTGTETLACSDGTNGFQPKWGYDTIAPMAPCVAAYDLVNWGVNDEDFMCGKCFKVTAKNTGNYAYINIIDKKPSGGLDFNQEIMRNLFGTDEHGNWIESHEQGAFADSEEVDADHCHGNKGPYGTLTPKNDPTCGIVYVQVRGCTDSVASNYNADANFDDGSCTYVLGCMNDEAENYNAAATKDDGSCIIRGCMNSSAENYDDDATVDDGSCIVKGCTDSTASNYNAQANLDDGSCVHVSDDGTRRCGLSWSQAQSDCSKTSCPVGTECPAGEWCYGSLEQCVNGQKVDTGTKRCGTNWSDANSCAKAEIITCPSGDSSDCPDGQTCVSWLTPCNSRRKI